MQQRVKSAWTELVPVPPKFLDKPKAKHRTLGSVMQNMQSDQATVKILITAILDLGYLAMVILAHLVIEIRYIVIAGRRQD